MERNENKHYIPRLADEVLMRKLDTFGAVLIDGCKWCGKTTTAEHAAKSVLKLQDPDKRESSLKFAEIKPSLLLQGDKPRLIDEWQDAPTLWDSIRSDIDETAGIGRYILTGSATPLDKNKPLHSGTGRIAKLRMYPMSLFESGESNGEVSLRDLADEKDVASISPLSIEDYARLAMRGGWPIAVIRNNRESANMITKEYLSSLVNEDIQRASGQKLSPTKASLLLRSLARNIAHPTKMSVIEADVNSSEDVMTGRTIVEYVDVLKSLFVIDDVPAWIPELRSKTAIRMSPKRCFADPSIALAALNATDEDLLNDFNTFGLVFENLCLRDLRVFAQYLGGEITFYSDKNGLECDAILHFSDGKWGAIEIKLGTNALIEDAVTNLLKLKEKTKVPPSFLMVLTGEKYAFRRPDGVYVVPLGCLKP